MDIRWSSGGCRVAAEGLWAGSGWAVSKDLGTFQRTPERLGVSRTFVFTMSKSDIFNTEQKQNNQNIKMASVKTNQKNMNEKLNLIYNKII